MLREARRSSEPTRNVEKEDKAASTQTSTGWVFVVVVAWFALNMTIANLNKWIFHRLEGFASSSRP